MTNPPAASVGLDAGHESSIPLPPLLLRELVVALRSIRYGAIELVIHDGRVVQLERREKVRLRAGRHGVQAVRAHRPRRAFGPAARSNRPDLRTSTTSKDTREIQA